MKLERKWSRAVIVLLAATLVFTFLPWWMYDNLGLSSPVWGLLSVVGAVLLLIAQGVIFYKKLRCLHCGKTVAPPQWKTGERYTCSRCGKPFIYDDEPDVPAD